MKGRPARPSFGTGGEGRGRQEMGLQPLWRPSTHSGWKGPLLGFEWRETDLTDILPWRAANVVQVVTMVPRHGAAVGRMKSDHSPGDFEL